MFDKKLTLEKYFYDNRAYFDTLVWLYRNFKNEFYKGQREAIKGYYEQIRSKTETGTETKTKTKIGKWWLYSYGRVLYIYCYGEKEEQGPRIGIECVFEDETFDKKLGMFHIYVATWAKKDFGNYEQDIKDAFPDNVINDDKRANNRAFLLVKEFEPNDKNIIPTLENTYNKLKEIIEKHKKSL